ncbi:MAG: hypothetical protein ACI8PT_002544 [Gammaproteobacteria bacterium]
MGNRGRVGLARRSLACRRLFALRAVRATSVFENLYLERWSYTHNIILIIEMINMMLCVLVVTLIYRTCWRTRSEARTLPYGRVARLMSHAMLLDGLDSGGVWSLARGLARAECAHKGHLGACAMERRNATIVMGAALAAKRLWRTSQNSSRQRFGASVVYGAACPSGETPCPHPGMADEDFA